MSRRTKKRRALRRARKAAYQPTQPPGPISDDRIVARFRSLAHRGFRFGFLSVGVTVEAQTSEELVRQTEREILRRTERQRES